MDLMAYNRGSRPGHKEGEVCMCMYNVCLYGWMDGWMDVYTYVCINVRMYVCHMYVCMYVLCIGCIVT